MPTYKILKNYRGRIVSLNKTPTSYLLSENKNNINNDILSLIKEHKNTSYFGLGNLNKNKSLNNCGIDIVNSLKDTNIKILTGDTMTTATIFHSIMSYDVDNFFFIGGTGKIGKALTILLINRKGKKVCLYSKSIERFNEIKNEIHIDLQENLTLTNNINDITNYSNIIIGKQIFEEIQIIKQIKTPINIYDYNVPFFYIKQQNINHIQVGILENKNKNILDGYFDISNGLNQYQLYSCYAGCILGFIDKRKTNEVGEICLDEIDYYWELGKKYGFTLVKNI
jgi:predicted amino acid dehydrogenase